MPKREPGHDPLAPRPPGGIDLVTSEAVGVGLALARYAALVSEGDLHGAGLALERAMAPLVPADGRPASSLFLFGKYLNDLERYQAKRAE